MRGRLLLTLVGAAFRPAASVVVNRPTAAILNKIARCLHVASPAARRDDSYFDPPYYLECCKKTCPPVPRECRPGKDCFPPKKICCRCPKRRRCCVKIRTIRRYAKDTNYDAPFPEPKERKYPKHGYYNR